MSLGTKTNHVVLNISILFTPQIPKFLKANFTYQGRVPAEQVWMNDMDGQTHSLTWTEEEIESRRAGFRAGARSGLYGKEVYEDIMKHLDTEMVVEGQHVLVIGSQVGCRQPVLIAGHLYSFRLLLFFFQKPWIEALLLEYGAKHVTTVDYVEIKSTHPQVTTITPQQMSEKYLDGTLTSFDSIVTFSSLEHSGLGRYGDDLNPFGDLIAMAKAWCVIKDGGKALVGVPSGTKLIQMLICSVLIIRNTYQIRNVIRIFHNLSASKVVE